jgi:hypothetical protein
LIRVARDSVSLDFAINAMGQRVAKSGTAFHYDLDGTLIAESTSTSEPLRETIWLGHLPVAMITFDHDGDGVRGPIDNCIRDDNPTQMDASGEGYGNRCGVRGRSAFLRISTLPTVLHPQPNPRRPPHQQIEQIQQ